MNDTGTSFGQEAHRYLQHRPDYPKELIAWILPPRATHALDLGAGTGKLTGQLVENGLTVTAVEPDQQMLGQLQAHWPQVTTRLETAEDTTLPDDCAEVIFAAQSWHWFDAQRAATNCARMLRPDGVLGVLWNQLNVDVPWVHRLSRIMRAGDVHRADRPPQFGENFSPPEFRSQQWEQQITPEEILELAKTRSSFLRASSTGQTRTLANLQWYLYQHLNFSPGEILDLPYVTLAWRTEFR